MAPENCRLYPAVPTNGGHTLLDDHGPRVEWRIAVGRLEWWERLRDHGASLAGWWDASSTEGVVTFGTRAGAEAALAEMDR